MKSRKTLLAALPALLLLFVVVSWVRRAPAPAPAATPARPARGGAAGDELPQIDLARLKAARPPVKVGRRDIFEFGAAEPDPEQQRHAVAPPPTTLPPPVAVVPTGPPPTTA